MGLVQTTWRSSGMYALVLIVLALVLYSDTLLYLTGLWNDLEEGEYAHGYLVLAISFYLIYMNRQRLLEIPPSPEYRAAIAVISAGFLWMLAAIAAVEVVQAIALLFLLLAIIWMVLGNRVTRVLAFPVLFIVFAIPVWFPLSPLLQNIAADSVFWFIRWLSIPAFMQDNSIVLPAGTLSVEEACSGLRYLLAALTLGSLYAYMNYSGLRSRITVVLVCAGFAVFTNILRVFIVVYLGYKTDMQHALVDDHLSLGWYLFAGGVVILLGVDTVIHNRRAAEMKESVTELDTAVDENDSKASSAATAFLVAGILVSIAPGIVYKTNEITAANVSNSAPELPQQLNEWVRLEAEGDDWMPVYHGAVSQKKIYRNNNDEVAVYVGFYPVQQQGKEVINVLNRISTNNKWRRLYPAARVQQSDTLPVLEQKLLKQETGNQKLVWYWYKVAGSSTANKYVAKVLQVLGLLKGETHALVVAVAAPVNNDIESSRLVLQDIVEALDEQL